VFHWNNTSKKKEIRIRYDEYNVSGTTNFIINIGPFKIDNVGEINIKLKNVAENLIIIIKASITEIGSTYLIEFFDEAFRPPYRLENMTKHDLIVTQTNSRPEDSDLINSYQIIDYALSHPMSDKMLKISLKTQAGQNHISDVKLDSFKNNETIVVYEKKNKINYVISMTREDAMKVIRIQEEYEFKIEHKDEEDDLHQRGFTYELRVPRLGISLINSSVPEEIAYVYFKNIDMCFEVSKAYQKFKIEILAIKIDDQLAKEDEYKVLKKNGGGGENFLQLNYCLVNNQGYEHVIHYKEFHLKLHQIELSLNGNFCSNIVRYSQSILNHLSLVIRASDEPISKDNLKDMIPEIVKETAVQKDKSIYFENLYIDKINVKFSFTSNPNFLNQTQFNPTLKFFIAMMMNMKQVELHFQRFTVEADPINIPIFMSNLKNHYLNE
jgi:hypothetical protein